MFVDRESMIYFRTQGVPPVTLTELFQRQADGNDFYDVPFMNGYGLPVRVAPLCFCLPCGGMSSRPWPHLPCCLEGPFYSNGFPLGCRRARLANLDGNPGV